MASVHIGTSGWHYDHWRGVFYPDSLPAGQWLPYYAAHFSCVEINNSFYRRPSPHMTAEWRAHSPEGFRFAIKAWRVITHRKKLKDCALAVASFFEPLTELGGKRGPVLFQLPPRWHRNPQRLDNFLEILPHGWRYAFEFRDPDWHHPDTYAVLRSHNAALCVYDIAGWHSPLVATSDLVYVRFHAPHPRWHGDYPASSLRTWAERIESWVREDRDVYAFFNNDQHGYAVKNALSLKQCLGCVC